MLNAAIRLLSTSIGDKAVTDNSPATVFRPLEEVDDGGGDGGGGGGGDSGGTTTPIPVSTEPSPPPGASNNDSPARAKCMASAYAVWLIEDAICRSQKNYRNDLARNDYNRANTIHPENFAKNGSHKVQAENR